jgi:hypothetical protein
MAEQKLKLGGLWKKQVRGDRTVLEGTLDLTPLGWGKVRINVWECEKKSERSPDYNVVLDERVIVVERKQPEQ